MKKVSNKQLIVAIAICLVLSTIPFFIKEDDENFNSTLASSFTILGTLISITTLIIALILFDRFGIDSKFKEKQVDAVIDLVENIQKTYFSIDAGKLNYANCIRNCALMGSFPKGTYDVDKKKELLFPTTFEKDLKEIYGFLKNPWFPKELKTRLEFLNIRLGYHIEESDITEYVKLNINNRKDVDYLRTFPKLTFEMFAINLAGLLESIKVWLDQHSNIKIDFDLQN